MCLERIRRRREIKVCVTLTYESSLPSPSIILPFSKLYFHSHAFSENRARMFSN